MSIFSEQIKKVNEKWGKIEELCTKIQLSINDPNSSNKDEKQLLLYIVDILRPMVPENSEGLEESVSKIFEKLLGK